MNTPWVFVLFGTAIWISTAYIAWRDLRRVKAEVQFIQGIFTKVSSETQPRLYWTVTVFRLLFILILGVSLMIILAEKL